MVVLTAETCWAMNEYWINNKISGIKLVFSSRKTLHVSESSCVHHQEFFTVHTTMVYVIQVLLTYTIAVCTVWNFCWWTEELSETCRVLFQKYIWEISASSWFYYKNISWSTVTWTSNSHWTFECKQHNFILSPYALRDGSVFEASHMIPFQTATVFLLTHSEVKNRYKGRWRRSYHLTSWPWIHWGKDNGYWEVSLYENSGCYGFRRCLNAEELPASSNMQIQVDVQCYNIEGTSLHQHRVMYVTASVLWWQSSEERLGMIDKGDRKITTKVFVSLQLRLL